MSWVPQLLAVAGGAGPGTLLRRLAGAPAIAQTMAHVRGLPVFAAIGSGVTNQLLG